MQFPLAATPSDRDLIDLIFHFQFAVQIPLTATRSISFRDSTDLISHFQCNFH